MDGEARQPAARRARAGAGRHGERRHAVRADVGRRRQLEQRLRDRQRHRLRRVAAAVRRRRSRRHRRRAPAASRRRDAHRERSTRRRPAARAGSAAAAAAPSGIAACSASLAQGVPVEGRAGGPGTRRRAGAPPARRRARRRAGRRTGRGAWRGTPAPAPPPVRRPRGGQARRAHSRRAADGGGPGPCGFLFRPSGVVYVVSSDGMLHVLGLAVGQGHSEPGAVPAREREAGPRRSRSDTTLYAATSGNCGGAPDGVWAIDLDSDAKPVVSWKTNGGGVVGAVAFTTDGTLIAAIGPGPDDRRRQGERDRRARPEDAAAEGLVHAAGARSSSPGRRSSGTTTRTSSPRRPRTAACCCSTPRRSVAPNHATPLPASKPVLGAGAIGGGDALATWQQPAPARPGFSSRSRASWPRDAGVRTAPSPPAPWSR